MAGDSMLPFAGHASSNSGAVGVCSVCRVRDASGGHDHNPIREFEDLVEVLGNKQHGRTLIPLVHELGANVCGRREVQAEAGVGRDEHANVAGEFARQDCALHVAYPTEPPAGSPSTAS